VASKAIDLTTKAVDVTKTGVNKAVDLTEKGVSKAVDVTKTTVKKVSEQAKEIKDDIAATQVKSETPVTQPLDTLEEKK